MYAEALERQVEVLRWVQGPRFGQDVRLSINARYGVEGRADREKSDQWLDALQRSIARAVGLGETFFWADDLAPLLTAGLGLPGTTRLRPEDLISPHGFIWFEKPLYMGDRTMPAPPPPPGADGISPIDLIFALSWDLVEDQALVHLWEGSSDRDIELQTPFRTFPSFSFWKLDQDLAANAGSLAKEHGEYPGVRLFATCMLFLTQEVVVAPNGGPLERHVRRRLERDGWERPPVVRVVRLRRAKAASAPTQAGETKYSCQWITRGHWRQQPCGPKQSERRTIWIAPHVKGPDDKPMKAPRATVFAVVR